MAVKISRVKKSSNFQGIFFELSIILAALALISGTALDYLNFKQNKTAYLPWSWLTNHPDGQAEKKFETSSKKPIRPEGPYTGSASAILAQKKLPLAAIIIDDMGEDLTFMQELINLRVPLTVAILPDSENAAKTAQLAARYQIDVLIHLPLEAFNGQTVGLGADGLITTAMSREEIWSRLEKDYERLPEARGLNNHMGSKGTANQYLMEIIMEFLKEKNLFFIDSRTSPQSIAYDLAVKRRVPAASRQIFLDADEGRNKIKDRLFELFSLAKKNGQAIGIGHPFEETLRILKAYLPAARNYGVQLATASEMIVRQEASIKN
ncbi:MAG: divergent polysaccharide deacetylase family protein [Acidobacteriota bacterium]|nr:divergent polysaccharide deacetylase family protein [Acidobacteriota bacterium]